MGKPQLGSAPVSLSMVVTRAPERRAPERRAPNGFGRFGDRSLAPDRFASVKNLFGAWATVLPLFSICFFEIEKKGEYGEWGPGPDSPGPKQDHRARQGKGSGEGVSARIDVAHSKKPNRKKGETLWGPGPKQDFFRARNGRAPVPKPPKPVWRPPFGA